MANALGKTDFEDLSAFRDGELDASRAAEVERLLREDPAWGRAHRELTALDAALDTWTAPAPAGDLADRVLLGVRKSARRSQVLRVAAWVGPVAAAAAILLVVVAVLNRPGHTTTPRQPVLAGAIVHEVEASEAYEGVPQAQRVELEQEIVRNLGFFRGFFEDKDVVEDFETLEAIEGLEREGT